MGKFFKAQYWVRLSDGTIKQGKEIEFSFPENTNSSNLFSEEKKHGRVSNIIGNLTGYSPHQIEVKNIHDLGDRSTEQRKSDYNSEKERKEQIKRYKAQCKKEDAELDEYLDRMKERYGSNQNNSSSRSSINSGGSSSTLFNKMKESSERHRIATENEKISNWLRKYWYIWIPGVILFYLFI